MTVRALAQILAAAASIAVLAGAPARAEERACRGTIGAVTVDNLRVPQGATCRLDRTRVRGTVKVERDATLIAARIVVVGNVQAENARAVTLAGGARVGGSFQAKQGGRVTVTDSFVDGSIQLLANRARQQALRNVVGADIQAFGNVGGVEIRRNRVDGNLQCKTNRPAPVGGGNVVQGNKQDQCRRL